LGVCFSPVAFQLKFTRWPHSLAIGDGVPSRRWIDKANKKRPEGRPSPEFRRAKPRASSEDKRPAYLGKRASRSFFAPRSTSETLVVRDNRDGCLPIPVNFPR